MWAKEIVYCRRKNKILITWVVVISRFSMFCYIKKELVTTMNRAADRE